MTINVDDILKATTRVERLRKRVAVLGSHASLRDCEIIQRRLGLILAESQEARDERSETDFLISQQAAEIAKLNRESQIWQESALQALRRSTEAQSLNEKQAELIDNLIALLEQEYQTGETQH